MRWPSKVLRLPRCALRALRRFAAGPPGEPARMPPPSQSPVQTPPLPPAPLDPLDPWEFDLQGPPTDTVPTLPSSPSKPPSKHPPGRRKP